NTESMLLEASAGYARLREQHHRTLEGKLEMEFLLTDALSLSREILASHGFKYVDTILASYFIHWASDKEAAVKKIVELMDRGSKFISIEEWPPIVTPGPFMTIELAKMIESTIMPLDLDRYDQMLQDNGLTPVSGSKEKMRIDHHHDMYGRVYTKF